MDEQIRLRNDAWGNGDSDDYFENIYLMNRLKDISEDEFKLFRGKNWSLKRENEYLRELLAWEIAPMAYVQNWLVNSPVYLDTRTASESQIGYALFLLVSELQDLNHQFCYVAHLSDRRLYQLIVRGVLSSDLKYLPKAPVVWNFCSFFEDCEVEPEEDETYEDAVERADEWNWLVYYASDLQRRRWLRKNKGVPLPPKRKPPYERCYIPTSDEFGWH